MAMTRVRDTMTMTTLVKVGDIIIIKTGTKGNSDEQDRRLGSTDSHVHIINRVKSCYLGDKVTCQYADTGPQGEGDTPRTLGHAQRTLQSRRSVSFPVLLVPDREVPA